MMVANVIGFLCPLLFILTYVFLSFLKLCSFGSAATHLPGCFCPWTFSLNIVLPKPVGWMMCFLLMTLVLVLILNPLLDFFLVYQADVSIFYTSNLY